MKEYSNDCDNSIKLALSNAEKRIKILDYKDKKSVLEEYKEWLSEGLNKHTILLFREDPII